MFNRLEGETAILRKGGVFKVVDLYERNGLLFAAWGGGYVRLYANGTSSADKVNIDTLAIEESKLYKTRLGVLTVAPGDGRKALTADETNPLMLPKE